MAVKNCKFEASLFQFELQKNWVSNLHLIMAFVRINAKEATTVAMRTLSALHGEEERADFRGFLTDLGRFSTLFLNRSLTGCAFFGH